MKSGLNSGDTVIVDGQLCVAPKGKVTIQSTLPPNAVVGNGTNSSDIAAGTAGGGQ